MRIAAAGDLVLMRPIGRPAESLLTCLEGADLVAANLEVPLTAADSPIRKGLTLRADPALIQDLAGLGVNVVTLANNHAGDQGWPALRALAAELGARGITVVGVGEDPAAAFAPRVRAGVAFVGATCVAPTPGMAGIRVHTQFEREERTDAEPGWPPAIRTSAEEADVARLEAAIRDARSRAAFVVALVHWGVSHVTRTEGYQHDLARRLVLAGAGVVFGCHAHVMQGVEVIEGVPVFYGLGTLLFHYEGAEAAIFPRDACVALVDVSEGRAVAARLVVGRLDAAGEPVRAHPERVELVHEMLRRSSPRWMVEMSQEGDELVLLY
ncbi:MAG TPA: CapA family protein [Candidatus Dormibacteraeota bacterium]|jgi:poly-gamma-glutamate synthesis protein (capsule biosynthesis protein)